MAFSLDKLLRRQPPVDDFGGEIPAPRATIIPATLQAPPKPNLFKRLWQGEYIQRQMQVLGVLFLLALLAMATLLLQDRHKTSANTTAIAAASELRLQAQKVSKAAAQLGQAGQLGQSKAANGAGAALVMLREGRSNFDQLLTSLLAADTTPELTALKQVWTPLKNNSEGLLTHEQALQNQQQAQGKLATLAPALVMQAGDINTVLAQQANSKEASVASQLPLLAQRMQASLSMLEDPASVTALRADLQNLRHLQQALVQGDPTLQITPVSDAALKAKLQHLATQLAEYDTAITQRVATQAALPAVQQLALQMQPQAEAVLAATDQLTRAYLRDPEGETRTLWLLGLALLAVLALGLLVAVYLRDLCRRTEAAERERQASEAVNRQTQAAILRLMDRLADVADGDLTVTIPVAEDVTGAIADSINWAIGELRQLVQDTSKAAARVDVATRITRDTSKELLTAAEHQSEQIQAAGRAVLDVARAMHAVSGHAGMSAQVAQQSLATAEKGQAAVQDTIAGMQRIRLQIQETAKRIKRLGESSQEIGEIVELISDITEQTNVLAVNAAIQAASAGEAGRGFSDVAEEVQRLAERSSEATRQVAALVRAIQADTQDAVAAMEHSTQDVVEGTRRSDAAGQALSEITTVTHKLTTLVTTISNATQSRSLLAKQVAVQMQDILRVTEQTTAGTRRTAAAVEELSQLATGLKRSAAGFKVSAP